MKTTTDSNTSYNTDLEFLKGDQSFNPLKTKVTLIS
jgi:hypothetical protein